MTAEDLMELLSFLDPDEPIKLRYYDGIGHSIVIDKLTLVEYDDCTIIEEDDYE